MSQFSTQELLEMASLDVLGLLDADERESFERAFRAAAPALQAEIRREQTRLAGDGMSTLLPQVELPLGLRARVIAALREAMQSVAGRQPDVIARIAPDLAPSHGVNRWWRAGAIGAVAASMVFGFMALQLDREYSNIETAMKSAAMTEAWSKDYGNRFERMLLNADGRVVQFAPAVAAPGRPEGVPKAALLVDKSNGRAQFITRNLDPRAGGYTLVAYSASGERSLIASVDAGVSGLHGADIASLQLEGYTRLALVETRSLSAPQPVVVLQATLI